MEKFKDIIVWIFLWILCVIVIGHILIILAYFLLWIVWVIFGSIIWYYLFN